MGLVVVEDFDKLVEWLSEREGQKMRVEIGSADPDVDADCIPFVMNTTLGGVESASETDTDRLMVMVRLPDLDESCFYFDPQRVSRIQFHLGVAKVWFHEQFYIALAASPGSD